MVVELAVLRQGFAKHYGGGGGVGEGEGCARGKGEAPMRLPTIYRGVGGWFLALQVHWALAKVGGKKSHHFLPHRLLSPFLGILILSLRDMILFLLRGDLGVPPLPTFMWVPHAGGPHFGTF